MSAPSTTTLLDVLGDTRARLLVLLRESAATAGELAKRLGMSAVGVRRHLQVLEREGLVEAETVRREGPGRPSSRYALTDRARRLFPDRSAELANELMEYLEQEHGRSGLMAFLRWRQARQGRRYAAQLTGLDDAASRAEVLARLLSEDGFAAQVNPVETPQGATVLELRQGHCAIAEVAEQHPELCAFEAALFKQVLGTGVSRKATIASGADACVCHIDVPTTKPETTTARSTPHGDQS